MNHQEPIIIIDDDSDDHFIFKEIAHTLNLEREVLFFKSGIEALNFLRTTTKKPFIILCDINMPKMNGLELRRTINQEEYLRKKSIPFVFLSTAASVKQIQDAYDLTVQGFFIKESLFEESEKTFKLILDYWAKCLHPNSVK